MKVLLEGTYGIDNFGDDLLLLLTYEFLISEGHDVLVAGKLGPVIDDSLPKIDIGRLDLLSKLRAISAANFIVIGGGGSSMIIRQEQEGLT